ncbi:ribosome recycling factor [Magnetococcales bacterium HHB-1]
MMDNELSRRMDKALSALKSELAGVRTGRASTSLLDRVMVDVYGSKMPINQVASLNVPEQRMITVQPWDKSTLSAVEKAIRESDLGLNPLNDGTLLRVPLPELTGERRTELVKLVHKYGEQAKVSIRGVRRDGLDQLRKSGISQDELRAQEKEVQELTDTFVKKVDETVAEKENDIKQI